MRLTKQFLVVLFTLPFLFGCAIKLAYQPPTNLDVPLAGNAQTLKVKIVDKRASGSKWLVLIGPLASRDIYWYNKDKGEAVAEIESFSQELVKEMQKQHMPVSLVTSGDADIQINIKNYQHIAHKFTGFDPFCSHHVLSADVVVNHITYSTGSYFFNGKLPIWSFKKEIADPCFNMPFSYLVKDMAGKINRIAFKMSASDANVAAMAKEAKAAADKESDEAIWKIMKLGASNNPAAVPVLKEIAGSDDRFVSACALGALGTLNAAQEVPFVIKAYETGDEVAQYMAFKAIGDFAFGGSQEAIDYINKVKALPKDDKSLAVLNYLDNVYTK